MLLLDARGALNRDWRRKVHGRTEPRGGVRASAHNRGPMARSGQNIDAAKLAKEVARLEAKAREDRSERRSPKAGGRL